MSADPAQPPAETAPDASLTEGLAAIIARPVEAGPPPPLFEDGP